MADWRVLCGNELQMAKGTFGTAIDFSQVRIFSRGFTPLQPKLTAVTPNGWIYFRAEDFVDDFSTNLRNAAWITHELTHVWQHQTGVNVILRGLFEREYKYGALDVTKPLKDYKIEQQASIVEDHYRITHGGAPQSGTGALQDYEKVIPFLPKAA